MSIMKLQILDRIKNTDLFNRFFKVNIFAKQTTNVVQFNAGGDDYNPPPKCEGLGGTFGNNPNNGFVMAWRDEIERKAAPGEKRIYAVDIQNNTVCGEIHLKNDGSVDIQGSVSVNITGNSSVNIKSNADVSIAGNANINAASNADINISGNANVNITASSAANITAPTVNLGADGGAFVLTENTTITDSMGGTCSIVSNTTNTKAV